MWCVSICIMRVRVRIGLGIVRLRRFTYSQVSQLGKAMISMVYCFEKKVKLCDSELHKMYIISVYVVYVILCDGILRSEFPSFLSERVMIINHSALTHAVQQLFQSTHTHTHARLTK